MVSRLVRACVRACVRAWRIPFLVQGVVESFFSRFFLCPVGNNRIMAIARRLYISSNPLFFPPLGNERRKQKGIAKFDIIWRWSREGRKGCKTVKTHFSQSYRCGRHFSIDPIGIELLVTYKSSSLVAFPIHGSVHAVNGNIINLHDIAKIKGLCVSSFFVSFFFCVVSVLHLICLCL